MALIFNHIFFKLVFKYTVISGHPGDEALKLLAYYQILYIDDRTCIYVITERFMNEIMFKATACCKLRQICYVAYERCKSQIMINKNSMYNILFAECKYFKPKRLPGLTHWRVFKSSQLVLNNS